eukprot:gene3085-3856_t
MLTQKKYIEDGDRVVIYAGKEKMSAITIKNGNIFNSKYGTYRHKNLIGLEYGSKVPSDDKNHHGFIHVVGLTSELWSITLDHRTQILFNLDISTILFNLEVQNGSKVVESGTGSGSLSSSFARTVAPKGHLYTFEFHEERVKAARKDFEDNGISQYITVTHRDACKDGFRLDDVEGMVGYIDAVFLDLPSPWEAIDHAVAVMREGAMLCSFSPCIEQVQKVCLKLSSEGKFQEIKTIEVLQRTYDTKLQEDEELNLQSPYNHLKTTTSTNSNSNETITSSTTTTTTTSSNNNNNNKIKTKKVWGKGTVENFEIGGIQGTKKESVLTRPFNEIRGHTGYLTFARYLPQ